MHRINRLPVCTWGATAVLLLACTAAAAGSATPDPVAPDASTGGSGASPSAQQAATPRQGSWQHFKVKPGDSLSAIFKRAGLAPKQWRAVLDIGARVEPLEHLKTGDRVDVRRAPDGRLTNLRYPLDALDTLTVERAPDDGTLSARIRTRSSRSRRVTAHGTVDGSLPGSLAVAGIPPSIATKLAAIYRYRANLSHSMQPGDRFTVIFKADYVGRKRVSTGPILAASIVTNGRSLNAFRGRNADGKIAYYDATGHPYKPSFSRHPVAYSHISSRFDRNRMNPVVHIRRPHLGVDMAAARGTPIQAAADGTVKFAGRKPGYGKLVELKHGGGYTSRYAHMSRLAKGLHGDDPVHKGQLIGYVGESGVTTGPHLHFEIRKDGVAHNPLTMKLPAGKPLADKRLATFANRIQPLVARLDDVSGAPGTLLASSSGLAAQPGCSRAGAVNAALALSPLLAPDHHALSDIFCVVATRDNA